MNKGMENEDTVYGPIHPGELLYEEFMQPLGISVYALSRTLGVDQMRIHCIVKGERAVTADTALRLSRYFGLSERYWMNSQKHYELELARQENGKAIEESVVPMSVTL